MYIFQYGQPSRMALHYAGVEYQNDVYGPGHLDWLATKFTLGMDFPNLPYYFDGEIKLTQSLAILRFIGKKHNLGGQNALEDAKIDMLIEHINDIKRSLVGIIYKPDMVSER